MLLQRIWLILFAQFSVLRQVRPENQYTKNKLRSKIKNQAENPSSLAPARPMKSNKRNKNCLKIQKSLKDQQKESVAEQVESEKHQ